MFGKFFASAFTGSMMASGADVFALWGYVIANAAGSRVELNPKLIAVLIGTTPEKIEESIKFLCAPDPNSRSKNDDGCRLIREGEFQYFVPNHEKYRSIRDEEGRREYNRIKQQEHRSKLKGDVKRPVNDSQSLLPKSTMSAHTEAEAEAEETTPTPYSDEFLIFWKAYPNKTGKGAAFKAWGKARINGSMEKVLEAIKLQSETDKWKRDKGQYIPNPATWLNERRWDDEITSVTKERGFVC